MENKQAVVETVGTASWLLMDLFWMIEQTSVAVASGVATVAAWLIAFRYLPARAAERSANGVVVCWAAMNLLWMAGELYEVSWLRTAALVSISGSFLLLGVAMWQQGASSAVTGLFRRFRVRPVKT